MCASLPFIRIWEALLTVSVVVISCYAIALLLPLLLARHFLASSSLHLVLGDERPFCFAGPRRCWCCWHAYACLWCLLVWLLLWLLQRWLDGSSALAAGSNAAKWLAPAPRALTSKAVV